MSDAPSCPVDPRLFGISPFLSHEISDREWADYEELGIRSLRIHLQAAHPWEAYDAVIDRAVRAGIEVLMLVSYESYAAESVEETPPWGGTRRRYTNPGDLVELMGEAAPRFAARGVGAWEIWNEANGTWHLPAEEFAKLMVAVADGFRGNGGWDPTATIVLGGIDAVGWFHEQGGNDDARAWFRDTYESSALRRYRNRAGRPPFDAVAIHPYGAETVDAFRFNLEHVCLETMRAHGDHDLPLWITELGDFNEDDDANADRLEHYVRAAAAHPAVARLHWFKYTYPGVDGHALYSLVMEDGRRRAAFDRYAALIGEMTAE